MEKGATMTTCSSSRLWRSVKYEEVYLKAYQDGREARIDLGNYFRFYNTPSVPTRATVTGLRWSPKFRQVAKVGFCP